MKPPRIFLIHATPVSIAPITEAFTRLWPEAKLANLLEDSLSSDLAEAGEITEAMNERFHRLATYAADCGADAILFTCSAFGDAIDRCKRALTIPVLKPNEAMIEQALARTGNVSIVATFEPAIASMTQEFQDYARQLGVDLQLSTVICPGAFDALREGNVERHDALVVESVRQPSSGDVLCFAQFSMTSAAQGASQASGRDVLTTPDSAVFKLRTLLNA